MKHLLLTTIAAVVLVGCGPSMSIHESAELGNIEVVKYAIADGVDVNEANKTGRTLLELATIEGNKGIVELLINNGADVTRKAKMDLQLCILRLFLGIRRSLRCLSPKVQI